MTLCGLHTPPSDENVPELQAPAHLASELAVPAITGDPAGHTGVECLAQLVLSFSAEYVPDAHATQAESVLAVPLTHPSPFLHDVTVHLAQAFVSFAAENIPDAHGVQEASTLSFPAANPDPAAHSDTL